MVLPGIRTDPRTPGGRPDSGSVNPGGPMPSVPQGTRQPNMGPSVGVPDPDKIEELFTQYTAGQITRDDLINQLHTFSEGQGGILGLLEGLESQGMEQGQNASQPKPPRGTAKPAAMPTSMPSQPVAGVRPDIKQNLDARHQQISALLQRRGLGPADANEMSQILNPHVEGHKRKWSSEEGLWMEDYSDAAPGTAPTGAQDSIAWDPTINVTATPNVVANQQNVDAARTGTSAMEMRALGGLGGTTGSKGAGIVERWDDDLGKTKLVPIGDKSILPEHLAFSNYTSQSALAEARGDEGDRFYEQAWQEPEWAKPQFESAGDYSWEGTGDAGERAISSRVVPQQQFEGLIEPDLEEEKKKEETIIPEITPGFQGHPGFQTSGGTEAVAMHGWSMSGMGGDEVVYQQFDADGNPLRQFSGGKGQQASGAYMFMDADGNTFPGFPGPGGTMFRSEEDKDNFVDWQSQNTARGVTYWNGEPIAFKGFDSSGRPLGDVEHYTQFAGKNFYFTNEKDLERFVIHRQWPDGSFVPGFEGGWPLASTDPNAKFQRGPLIDPKTNPQSKHGFGDKGMPEGLEIDTATNRPIKGSGFNPDAKFEGGFGEEYNWGDGTVTPPVDEGGVGGVDDVTGAAATAGQPVDPVVLEEARMKAPMLYEFVGKLDQDMMTPRDNDDLAQSMISALSEIDQLNIKGDQAFAQRLSDVVVNALDREAVTARADADRLFQEGVAVGQIGDAFTIARIAEENKQAFALGQQSGYLPIWDKSTSTWRTPTASEIETGVATGGIEREALRISDEDKQRQYTLNLANIFGQYVNPENDPAKSLQTLEGMKFGLTKALQVAEVTGKIPGDWKGDSSFTNVDTFAMKRFVFEKDMGNRNADVQDRLARNAEQTQTTNLTIANNRNLLERHIADGNLAEAVETRKDQTWLANQKIELDRDKMKLDTLMALSNPATFLFAQRFGLLDDIGAAMGIDWGDDIIDVPPMLPDNYIPSLTEFQQATPMQREVMLAEMASSGGYTSNEAVRRIMEGAPGSRAIRRPSVLGVSR